MSSLPGSQILTGHPELAAKSVETKSKRDFMPLPGVSESYNCRTLSQSYRSEVVGLKAQPTSFRQKIDYTVSGEFLQSLLNHVVYIIFSGLTLYNKYTIQGQTFLM